MVCQPKLGRHKRGNSTALRAGRIERPLHLCAAPGLIAGEQLLHARYPANDGITSSFRIGNSGQVENRPSSPAPPAAILASTLRSCPLQPIPQLRQWNRRYPRPSRPLTREPVAPQSLDSADRAEKTHGNSGIAKVEHGAKSSFRPERPPRTKSPRMMSAPRHKGNPGPSGNPPRLSRPHRRCRSLMNPMASQPQDPRSDNRLRARIRDAKPTTAMHHAQENPRLNTGRLPPGVPPWQRVFAAIPWPPNSMRRTTPAGITVSCMRGTATRLRCPSRATPRRFSLRPRRQGALRHVARRHTGLQRSDHARRSGLDPCHQPQASNPPTPR